MARKPDTPCAGGCGRLLWSGRTSLPAGQRTCRDCRRRFSDTEPDERGGPCSQCGQPTEPHRRTCSEVCARERQALYFRSLAGNPERLKRAGACDDCGSVTLRGKTVAGRFCDSCAVERKRARNSRKNHRRRSPLKVTDITASYERELRAAASHCPLCASVLTSTAGHPNSKQLDHIIPIAIGGKHVMRNVRILCRTCNLTRPKDGSDLSVSELAACSGGPQSIVAPMRFARCRCGAKLTDGRCRKCQPKRKLLRPEDGVSAAAMRADGVRWQEISDRLGLSGPGTAYYAARKFGAPEVVTQWPREAGYEQQGAA